MNPSTYPPPTTQQPRAPMPVGRPWSAGRITAVVLGALLMMGAFALGLLGGTLALADNGLRDDDGFLMSGDDTFATATYAMVSENLEIHADGSAEVLPERLFGDARIDAEPNGDAPLFLGIAATSDVQDYLDGVGHATFTGFEQDDPVLTTSDGGAPGTPPTDSDIWVDQSSGTGTQSIEWEIEDGDWTVVVMNADGSRGVSTELSAGATVPALGWVVALTLAFAGAVLLVSLVLLWAGLRRS